MALKKQTLNDLDEQKLEGNINNKSKEKKKKNKKTKKIWKRVGAGLIAVALACTTAVAYFTGKSKIDGYKKNSKTTSVSNTNDEPENEVTKPIETKPEENTPEVIKPEETTQDKNFSISDLGTSLEFPKTADKEEYKNPSNDKIDTDKVVEDNNGTLWIDNESKEESNNIDKKEIDTKDDTLAVKPNDKVVEKKEGFEIKDETGNVIDNGTLNDSEIPNGYQYDNNRDEIVKEEELEKYVYSEYDFYYIDGTLLIGKGDLISIETYEKAKKELSMTKPEKKESVEEIIKSEFIPVEDNIITEDDIITEEGITNSNGTYTIYGTTYESKADFEQYLLTPDAYGFYNGMVMSLDSIEALINQKQLRK